MAGFSFGTTTPAPAATNTGFSFGSSTNTQAALAPSTGGFGFGGTASTNVVPPASGTGAASGFFGTTTTATTATTNPIANNNTGFGSTTSYASNNNTAQIAQQQQQSGMVNGTSLYTALPSQAQVMITQIQEMSLRQRRTLASVEKMAPRLLSMESRGLGEGANAGEEKKKLDAASATGSSGRGLTSVILSSSSIDVDENAYLPLQIEAMLSNLQSLTVSLKRSMAMASNLQEKARDSASNALTEATWPIEALAARRRVQLTFVDNNGQPLSEKKRLEQKMKSMLDREAALVDRKEQIPSQFLWKLVKSFEARLQLTQREVDALQRQILMVVESNANNVRGYERQREHQITRDDIASIHNTQNDALLRVAGEVAATHEKVEALRSRWRRYAGGRMTDPFRKADADDVLKRNREEARLRTVMLSSKPLAQTSTSGAIAATPSTGGLFGSTPASTTGGGLFGNKGPVSATGGLFGAPAPASATGGLFGNTPAPAPATGGGLFGAPAAASATGGLFGSAPAPAPAIGGGLFGAPAPASSGLFGSAPAPAPATGGGLFGAPAPATGSLFGSTPAPAPATGGGIFGAPAPASGGLFGSTPASAPATGGGLFGAPAPATGGLFGSTPAPATGLQRSSSIRSKNKGRSRR